MVLIVTIAFFLIAYTGSIIGSPLVLRTPAANSTCPQISPPTAAGNVQHAGVNIAGFDFGCDIDGTCVPSKAYPPLGPSYGLPDGPGQMKHFAAEGLNTFRLPVGWQYLTNSVLGGTLDSTNFNNYNTLVQACLNTGASCIVDIHNYARWNGGIVGQGGPSNGDLVSLWAQIAVHYASEGRVIFGVINEPHDIPDINTWAATVQAVVTAIRAAGATSQIILLPGNNWTSAATFVSSGSADALNAVQNLDGSVTNLVFDVHKYLDSDNSGTHVECVTNNIDDAFAPLAQYLRCNSRQAFLTETGGGNVDSCVTYLCQQLEYLNTNSDVFLGWVGWGAGSFDSTYTLTETPTGSGSSMKDTLLTSSCIVASFHPLGTNNTHRPRL